MRFRVVKVGCASQIESINTQFSQLTQSVDAVARRAIDSKLMRKLAGNKARIVSTMLLRIIASKYL